MTSIPMPRSLVKTVGIKLASPAEGKAIFKSVRTIAEFVNENRKK